MRRVVFALAAFSCAAALHATESMPRGFFRGILISWTGEKAGTLTAQSNAGGLFDCQFDAKTYMEIDKLRVTVAKLREGDHVEILADRHPGQTFCYVRTLHVISYEPPKPVRRPGTKEPEPKPKAAPIRHGIETISGVITRIDGPSFQLRTRNGEETVVVRRDTRFFGNGLKMEPDDLAVNQRVAVEVTPNWDGDLEAFQVTWGSISNVK